MMVMKFVLLTLIHFKIVQLSVNCANHIPLKHRFFQ